MLDHERVQKYVKELRASKLLEAGENWKIVEHKLKMHPLLPSMKYVFREEYGPDYCIEFNRVSGAFRELTGTWELIPQEDDSSVVLMYSTFVDFGWFIPQSWVNRGINKRVPALLNAFREEVISEVEARDAGEEK